MSRQGARVVALALMVAVAMFGSAVPAQALQYVISGNDFSGTTQNTGGNITINITDVVGGVKVEVFNNMVDPGAKLDVFSLNTSVAPLTSPSAACVDCADIGIAVGSNPGASFGSNAFKEDGDGFFDIEVNLPSSSQALTPTESIIFTILSSTAGFNANSFNAASCGLLTTPSCAGTTNGSFLAAAHVTSLPPTEPGGPSSDWLGTNTPVPEPMTMFLGGTGLLALGYAARKRLFGGRLAGI